MARYVVVKISNADQHRLIFDRDFTLAVTDDQVLADLAPDDLRALNLWAEAGELRKELELEQAQRREVDPDGATAAGR